MLNIHTNPAPLNDLELQEIEQLAQLAVKGTIDWHDGSLVLRVVERLRRAEARLKLVTRIKPNPSCEACKGSGFVEYWCHDEPHSQDCPCTHAPIKTWFTQPPEPPAKA
jgi:hypothetical protein